jgi:hypothetical protein
MFPPERRKQFRGDSPKNWRRIMKKILVLLIATMFTLGLALSAHATSALSLVIDGSGSIWPTDFDQMIDDYQAVITDPSIVPQDGTVALNVIQFSTSVVEEIPFTIIDSQATADAFAAAMDSIIQMGMSTYIGAGIDLAVDTLLAFDALEDFDRLVIDVSTDGASADDPYAASAAAIADGIDQVNVLGIGSAFDVGFNAGVDSFNMTVDDWSEFAEAIATKIGTETGTVPEPSTLLLIGTGLIGLAGFRMKFKV